VHALFLVELHLDEQSRAEKEKCRNSHPAPESCPARRKSDVAKGDERSEDQRGYAGEEKPRVPPGLVGSVEGVEEEERSEPREEDRAVARGSATVGG
jgi:hypothetical protein